MALTEHQLFFKGEAKNCKNCFYFQRGFLGNQCNLWPNWSINSALRDCGYREWKPNHKLHHKKEK